MKDKEKQIEEMARDIRDLETWQTSYTKAKILLKQGYQKIDKDSIIVSKEEYKRLKDYTMIRIKPRNDVTSDYIQSLEMDNEGLLNRLKEVRKETAEKIIHDLINIEVENESWIKNKMFVDYINKIVDKLEKFAKQFGVEIKE